MLSPGMLWQGGLPPLLILGWMGLLACRSPIPDPEPRSVQPSFGYNGDDTLIQVVGEHFYPKIEVDTSKANEPQIDDGFRVFLDGPGGEYELSGVGLRDYTVLEAVVPDGYAPGRYDVRVETPSGRTGALADAFTVTDTLADHLNLEVVGDIVYEVNESAQIRLQLLDRNDAPVFDDLEVEVTADADDGEVEIEFSQGLEEQTEVLRGVRGRLGLDGAAQLQVTAQTPDLVTLRIRAVEEDSTVNADSARVEWESGAASATEIFLPETNFAAVAGEPFLVDVVVVDEFGNPVGTEETLLLRDVCSGWLSAPVEIDGVGTAEVEITEASSDDCPENRVEVVFGPPGASEPFQVEAAPVSHFEVVASPPVVVAGEMVNAFITPVDDYGNPASWPGTGLSLSDTAGGVQPGQFQCVGVQPIFCQAMSVVAGSNISLVATANALTGSSDPYTVVAGPPVSLEVEVPPEVRAGTPVDVDLFAEDAWGNPVEGDALLAAGVWFSMEGDPVDCEGPLENTWECVFTVASDAAVVTAESLTPGMSSDSDPFVVHNGPLAQVALFPSETEVLAGEVVDWQAYGFDLWGNPYRFHDDPVIQVTDTTGSLTLTSMVFEDTGLAVGTGFFTRAGTTAAVAWQDGEVLGTSGAIEVSPGEADELEVRLPSPWVWVDESVAVSVRALDAFGNATDLDGVGEITSESGATAGAPLTLVDGEGQGFVQWTSDELDERLDVSVLGVGGSSGRVVVARDCVLDPTVSVEPDPVACLDETSGTGAVTLDVSGSSGIQWVAAAVGNTLEDVFPAGSPVVVNPSGVGAHPVSVLAIDALGCGAVASTTGWVAPNDGHPAGRLELELSAATMEAGVGNVDVEALDVRDCEGDLAAGQWLGFRVDRGVLGGTVPDSWGLTGLVNAQGSVVIDWGEAQGGEGTLWAWSDGGGAGGQVSIPITGDLLRPHVLDQDPVGVTSGMIDAVVLQFDEPLLETSVEPGNFSVTGPVPVGILAADLDLSGTEVTLWLADPVDADDGVWAVTAWSNPSLSVRDEAGNRLDGAWLGGSASYVGVFGAVPNESVPVDSCSVSLEVFRPDGAAGAGQEAEAVEVSAEAAATPERWRWVVWSPQGEKVRDERLSATASSQSWSWNGRDQTGRVVVGGNYVVEVFAEDAYGNTGVACALPVTVHHRYEEE